MSYDIDLVIDTGGEEPYELYTRNHTSNTARMWRTAGLDLRDFHGRPASELTKSLLYALTAMELNPEKYRAMEPDNGWGTYESTVKFLRDLIDACMKHPLSTVRVCW